MLPVISALLAFVASLVRSRLSLSLENVAFRHQLAVYKQTVHRPRFRPTDRLCWTWLSRLWPGWQQALAFGPPRTGIAWQRQRCRDHWRRFSQQGKSGRPAIAQAVRDLMRPLWPAHPPWGSPRIVGALRKLGSNGATSTVAKYRVQPRKPPSPTWNTFLKTHMRDLVALDFFVGPTVTFRGLFVLVLRAHERRRGLHCHITAHPTAQWTAQQVVEAFPWEEALRYLLRDCARLYGTAFRQRVQHMGIEEVGMARRRPWQHPYVERLIGSIRRECLDQVIILHERHLQRLLTRYVASYHRFRTHLSLAMDGPEPRPIQLPESGKVIAVPEVGGLPHPYERAAA